jgi:hypothetical protein
LPSDNFHRSCLLTVFLVMAFILLPMRAGAQTPEQFSQVMNRMNQSYGSDYNLLNGRQYYLVYSSDSEPYLISGQSQPGRLVIRGVVYDGVPINYDLYQQVVILQFIGLGGEIRYLALNRELVDEFVLNGQLFRKVSFDGVEESYAQVIPAGTLRFLITYKKDLNFSPSALATPYHYSKTKKRIFLQSSGSMDPVGSRSSFLGHFNESERPRVKQYMKNERIRIHRASDSQLQALLEYCDQHGEGQE